MSLACGCTLGDHPDRELSFGAPSPAGLPDAAGRFASYRDVRLQDHDGYTVHGLAAEVPTWAGVG